MKRMSMIVAAMALQANFAWAGEPHAFTQQEFDQLRHGGKPVVIHVAAPWCPVCKQQKPIIESLSKHAAYQDVANLTVDFDTDKATLRTFDVSTQSTLIAFKNGQEVARSIGETNPGAIENMFKKVIN